MKISEIFTSIEGEGARSGFPCTFVRLFGCNLNCSYCDSRYACEGNDFTQATVSSIVDEVKKAGTTRVTITGGEPLVHGECCELIHRLMELPDMKINIETNGSVPFHNIELLGKYRNDRLIITMDWKSISSGMSDKMVMKNLACLTKYDVLKFVVGTDEDLQQMKSIVDAKLTDAQIFVSPIFGQIEPEKIVNFLLENHLNDVRIQLQMHKIIWDPNKRGV